MSKWDERFLDLAKLVASWSKDPSTKCGAVIVDKDKRIISVGFNGLLRKVLDSSQYLQDRERKLKMVIHAEKNAILFAGRRLEGCTIYVWPMPPCSQCAAYIIQSGISKVVAAMDDAEAILRWEMDIKITQQMLFEAGVDLYTRPYGGEK